MTTKRYDRAMTFLALLWINIVLVGVLLPLWDATSWGTYGSIVGTATAMWALLAILLSWAHSRWMSKRLAARRAEAAQKQVFR